ncbi:sorting nexin-4 isoform X1 [Bufo bufo]|uniref:sorting nexin-4 isoform X1 n=1 Tax=Bufo bufo TaxID=8384 RepID=UPI001ABDEE65|nr:sorting nexin-4 isoform X1 [Bufo bufo]
MSGEEEEPSGLFDNEDPEDGEEAPGLEGAEVMSGEDSLLKKFEISVSEAEKRSGKNAMNMQETYTAYLIETRMLDTHSEGHALDCLWRRYSEFELLRTYLSITYPFVVVPPLPEKRAEFVWHKLSADNMDPDFVERRRIGLENFLLRVASHPVLCHDKIFSYFLNQENSWKEALNEAGLQVKTDSRLKSLNATFRVKNPDKRFTELKHYSDELQSVVSHLLRVRARVADRLYGVYKVHGNYGRVFSEWSAIEKEMGDGLQSAGHHMDVYAASIDDILEEEEHYADQLKEYLFYAEALRAVCRKHELMQYDLEMSALDLASKKQQSEELATGVRTSLPLYGGVPITELTLSSCLLFCPPDGENIFAKGNDQQTVWSGDSGAERGQDQAAGGTDRRGRGAAEGAERRERGLCAERLAGDRTLQGSEEPGPEGGPDQLRRHADQHVQEGHPGLD